MTRATILVIEEDPDLARLFESILQIEGYSVRVEMQLDGARRALSHYSLDAVIYDWSASNPTGYLWVDEVRNTKGMANVPMLLVCDGLPPRVIRDRLWNLGVPTIEKPFDLLVFCRAIEAILPRRERAIGV
ncbi:MAG: response regulator [Roseiflexaceae bacterium]|nr:response regulator [Roseiflexaceae bacterium]